MEHAEPLQPFSVVRNGEPLLLTPVLATSSGSDDELREAAISLFHHVLPGVARKFMRKLFASEHARTILLMRSVEDVLAERLRRAAPDEVAAPPAAAGDDGVGSEDTSSFSGPSDDDAPAGASDVEHAGSGAGMPGSNSDGSSAVDDESLADELGGCSPAGAPAVACAVRTKHRVVGAASFELVEEAQCPRDVHRVLQVTLLGVRTKFQALGLGAQLLRRVLSPRLSGAYDATITFADHDAVRFFRKFGFSDDAILTSRFRAVVDAWDQSTLMVRHNVCAPPRGVAGGGATDALLYPPAAIAEPRYLAGDDLRARIDGWREARVLGYSQELSMLEMTHAELCMLRQRVVRQDDYVRFLKAEVVQLHQQRGALADEVARLTALLQQQQPHVDALQQQQSQPPRQLTLPRTPPRVPVEAPAGGSRTGASAAATRDLQGGQREVMRVSPLSSLLEPMDAHSHECARLAEAFAASLRPADHACGALRLRRVWQLASAEARAARSRDFDAAALALASVAGVRGSGEREAATGCSELELYLGAPVEVLQHVLVNGFDLELWPPRNEALRQLEVFGEGMYLTRSASQAHRFCAGCGFVLLVRARLGNCHAVGVPDRARSRPDGESGVLVVPGRQLPGDTPGAFAEEFVIFKKRIPPLMPLCLLEVDEAHDAVPASHPGR